MAIEYFGSFPCKVREAISDADLLEMERDRNRAHAALDGMRSGPGAHRCKPESEWTFKLVTAGPDGILETEFRIDDLLARTAPLEDLAKNCSNCPANVRSSDFGCGGAIHYPITAQAERWLVSRLPSDLTTIRGKLLLRALVDFNFDGSVVDGNRQRKDVYESATPAQRRWGGFFSTKTRMTSSQILQMAFHVGSLQPAHAKLVAYFLGFLNDDFSRSDDPANAPQPEDDVGTIEMKYFFSIAALAGPNNVSVLVDA